MVNFSSLSLRLLLTVAVGALGVHNSYAKDVLRQVHVITRHGVTVPLPEHARILEESMDTAVLTPSGQRQHYDLGVWLRDRYYDSGFFSSYDPTKVRLESSNFHRTLVSASSLALSLFPTSARGDALIPEKPANVPVQTNGEDINDVTIRAYDKCKTFLADLIQLYESHEWTKLQDHHKNLLTKLAQIKGFEQFANPEGFIPLKDIWNIYDAVHTEKVECQLLPNSEACNALPYKDAATQVTGKDWTAVQELVKISELHKYGLVTSGIDYSMPGNLIGSNLLNQIASRMRNDPNMIHASDSEDNRFYLYSAHYPTILGILATLDHPFFDEEVIPGYASALIFELYQDPTTNARRVSVQYKPGDIPEPKEILLGGQCKQHQEHHDCLYHDFLDLVNDVAIPTYDEWCRICDNDSADVCLAAGMHPEYKQEFYTCNKLDLQSMAIVAGMGGIALGSSFAILFVVCLFRRKRHKMKERLQHLEVDEPITEIGPELS